MLRWQSAFREPQNARREPGQVGSQSGGRQLPWRPPQGCSARTMSVAADVAFHAEGERPPAEVRAGSLPKAV